VAALWLRHMMVQDMNHVSTSRRKLQDQPHLCEYSRSSADAALLSTLLHAW
jgi:hypothetical protein